MSEILATLPNSTSLQSLLVLSTDQVTTVLHRVIDSILGRVVLYNDITSASKLSVADMDHLVSCLEALIITYIANNWTLETSNSFTNACGLSSLSETLYTQITCRNQELKQALIERTCSIFPHILEDIDWSVKLTVASSKSSSMREPSVALSLRLRNLNNTEDKGESYWVRLELNKDELDTMINSLSKPLEIAQNCN